MTTSQPATVPDGYYATPDPRDPAQMTYWRMRAGQPTVWPPRARYGPTLLRSDVPAGLRAEERSRWIQDWWTTVAQPWHQAILDQLAGDPAAAGARFAELTTRCCNCGRALTDAASRVYGIGPDCRAGLPGEWLAALARAVGRAHAARGDAR